MKIAAKHLSLALCIFTACKSKPVSVNDPQLKAMVDSIVRVRVEKYVQATMHQYILQQQSNSNNSDYRRIAREEAERAAGRAAQEHQSQEDAVLNAQHGY